VWGFGDSMRNRMGTLAVHTLARLGLSVAALAVLVDVVHAFAKPPKATPGPLLGGGLALAGAVVATILVVRHFRQKN